MVGSVGVATANWALPWCRTSAPRYATDLRGTFPRRASIADANVPVGWFIRLCLNDLRGGSRSTRAGDARLAVAAPRGDPSASPVFRCVPVAHTSSPRHPCSTYVAQRRPSAPARPSAPPPPAAPAVRRGPVPWHLSAACGRVRRPVRSHDARNGEPCNPCVVPSPARSPVRARQTRGARVGILLGVEETLDGSDSSKEEL